MTLRTLIHASAALAITAALAGCVYDPTPAPPSYYSPGYYSYGYGPGYYRPEPQVALGFSVGGGRGWHEHEHHRYHHWP
jgi:hypothetical protein